MALAFNQVSDRNDPQLKYFVAQEIAAYWKFMTCFYSSSPEELRALNRKPHLNYELAKMIPLEMCPFRMPNQDTVDFYLKMLNRAVVAYRKKEGTTGYRKLVKGEQEILLSLYV